MANTVVRSLRVHKELDSNIAKLAEKDRRKWSNYAMRVLEDHVTSKSKKVKK